MKIPAAKHSNQSGSVLLVSLLTAAIIGVALASYLFLTQSEVGTTRRSETWNNSLALTEAGIEESMALINRYSGTTTAPQNWTNTAAADGWSSPTDNVYYLKRYLGSNYYEAYITNLNDSPTSKSSGSINWNCAFASAAQPCFAAAGASLDPTLATVSRAVVVTTSRGGPVFGGILTKKGILLSGGMVINRFNSQDQTWSTNGLYDPSRYKDGGDIATVESNVVAAISGSGGAKVYGHVATGPNSTESPGTSSWGSKDWVNGGNQGIQPGWSRSDMNIAIPDAPAPGLNGVSFGKQSHPISIKGTNYDYYISTGDYQASSLSIQGGDAMYVDGKVKVLITSDYTVGGSGYVYISPGSSLTLWVGGKATVSGGGTVNGTGFATNCTYYGQPSCNSFTLSGSSAFVGTVYAPQAAFTMSGGSGGQLFVGAIVADSANISGGYAFHYDESLGGQSAGSYYRIASWQEVSP